jgi:hypothetical protein
MAVGALFVALAALSLTRVDPRRVEDEVSLAPSEPLAAAS